MRDEFLGNARCREIPGSSNSGVAVVIGWSFFERCSQKRSSVQICTSDEQVAWSQAQEYGPYDLCLAIDVLYHIVDDTTWRENLQRLCANTSIGGLLLIADYFYEQSIDQPSKVHVRHRKMQSYLDVLDGFGFQVEAVQPIFYFLNRIVSGPWRDHNRVFSPALRALSSNLLGLRLLEITDALVTGFTRPMNPKAKTRFLAARRHSPS
jgi:hypothetical protein